MKEEESDDDETFFEAAKPHTESEQGDDEPAWLKAAVGQTPIRGAFAQPRLRVGESAGREFDSDPAEAPNVMGGEKEEEPMWLKAAAEMLEVPSPVRAHRRSAPAPATLASTTGVATSRAEPSQPLAGTTVPAPPSWPVQSAGDQALPLRRPTAAAALVVCLVAVATRSGWGNAPSAATPSAVASDQELVDAHSATAAAVSQLGRGRPQSVDALSCPVGDGSSCDWCTRCCVDGSAAALELSLAESALLRSRLEAKEPGCPVTEAARGEEEHGGWGGVALSLSCWALLAYALAGLYASRTST
eukprot:scaffold8767_cov121-Isochrysis_galbana.AAC.6